MVYFSFDFAAMKGSVMSQLGIRNEKKKEDFSGLLAKWVMLPQLSSGGK